MKLSHIKSQKGRDAKFHVLTSKSRNVVLKQIKTPPSWFGLKFFNVFGFDESKKNKMSSIVYQAFQLTIGVLWVHNSTI